MTQTLSHAVAQTSRIKFWGKMSATCFFLAALAVVDGLQALARHDFNSFELIPGETSFISGMLPEGVTTHEDLEIRVNGVQGLSVRPVASFKGFWLGGQMWRAEITVPEFTPPGQASLTIVDLIRPTRKIPQDEVSGGQSSSNSGQIAAQAAKLQGGQPEKLSAGLSEESSAKAPSGLPAEQTTGLASQVSPQVSEELPSELSPELPLELPSELPLVQNPMLVYDVTIWPSALDRQRAEKSFVRRVSGFSSFWLAGLAAIAAILAGVKGWFTFATVEKSLAAKGFYIVHGVKKPGNPSPSGYTTEDWQALCAYFGDPSLNVGDAVMLFDNDARPRGEGVVREMRADSFMAAFPAQGEAPVYSWILAKRATVSDD